MSHSSIVSTHGSMKSRVCAEPSSEDAPADDWRVAPTLSGISSNNERGRNRRRDAATSADQSATPRHATPRQLLTPTNDSIYMRRYCLALRLRHCQRWKKQMFCIR